MSVILQAIGTLIALASFISLLAGMLFPGHGLTQHQAATMFVPFGLIGLLLMWCRRKLLREELARLKCTQKGSSQHPVAD